MRLFFLSVCCFFFCLSVCLPAYPRVVATASSVLTFGVVVDLCDTSGRLFCFAFLLLFLLVCLIFFCLSVCLCLPACPSVVSIFVCLFICCFFSFLFSCLFCVFLRFVLLCVLLFLFLFLFLLVCLFFLSLPPNYLLFLSVCLPARLPACCGC